MTRVYRAVPTALQEFVPDPSLRRIGHGGDLTPTAIAGERYVRDDGVLGKHGDHISFTVRSVIEIHVMDDGRHPSLTASELLGRLGLRLLLRWADQRHTQYVGLTTSHRR